METTEPIEKKQKHDILAFLIIKALIAIGLGMAFLLNPQGMVETFSYVIGAALLLYGGMEVYKGFRMKKHVDFGNLIIDDGVLNLIVGLVLLFWPNLAPNLIMIILALWIMIGGLIQLYIANKYKNQSGGRNVRGVITLIIGLLILFNPSSSVQLVSMMIGALSLLYGIYMLILIFNFGKK